MSRKRLAWELVTLIWLAGTMSLLRMGTLEGYADSDVLCGPWGCLPPTAALMAMHGFWLMLLGLLGGFLIGFFGPARAGRGGRIFVSTSLLGLIGLLGWAIFTWNQSYGEMTPRRFAMRFLHLLVTNTDLPFVQRELMGVVLLFAYRQPHARRNEYDTANAIVAFKDRKAE